MLLQSRQKVEFNVLDSQNLLTEVLFDPVVCNAMASVTNAVHGPITLSI